MVEGAPLLREYMGKTCIKGSNPLLSAILQKIPELNFRDFLFTGFKMRVCIAIGKFYFKIIELCHYLP